MKIDPKAAYLLSKGWKQAMGSFEDPVTGDIEVMDYAYQLQKSREKNKPFDPVKFLRSISR